MKSFSGYIIILLHAVLIAAGWAQNVYVPLDTPTADEKKLFLKQFKSRYQNYIDKKSSVFKGKQRLYFKNYLQTYFNKAYTEFSENELYMHPSSKTYLKSLLDRLRKHNSLPDNIVLDFSRRVTPNAYSVGEGTVVIHLELLEYLENEDQLMAVLAHELSHYILDHLGNSYGEYVRYITSPAYKNEVRNLYKSRYGRTEKAEEMLEHILYSRMHKSRKQELEADSLGLILYRRAGYPPDEFFRLMEILDSVDEEKDILTRDFLREWFNTPSQPFDENWFYVEDYSDYVYHTDEKADSLKTHPEMGIRLSKIKELNKRLNIPYTEKPAADPAFNEWKRRALYEKPLNLYLQKKYGGALYHTLKLLQKYPDDPFLLKMFVLSFEHLTRAKKELALSRYVPPYNPRIHSDGEKLFIHFIHNMDYAQMQTVLDYYKEKILNQNINLKIFNQ